MADETLTVSEPMTIEQIDAEFPDQHVFLTDVEVDEDDPTQVIAGRVLRGAETKWDLQHWVREHLANKPESYWLRCAFRRTVEPRMTERMGYLVTRVMGATR